MIVTDEMVEAACRAVIELRNEDGASHWPSSFADALVSVARENMRAALTAALAAQGPQVVDRKDVEFLLSVIDYMSKATGETPDAEDAAIIDRIRSAIVETAQPVAVPDGWQLVPIKPTAEMKSAVSNRGGVEALAWGLAAWDTMLAAAPQLHAVDDGGEHG